MIKNKDVVFEVRDLLFHLNKAYAKLEDNTRILNNGEMGTPAFQYLEKVTELLENFKNTSISLKKEYMFLRCSESGNKTEQQ